MARTLYALLVGIDQYQLPVPPLAGCVNDIRAFREVLLERVKDSDFVIDENTVQVLTNEEATRQNIIDGFQKHLTKAGNEDVALFYYSGHGAQEKAPPEFLHLEPDGLDETLVCYDSRREGFYDLADKELGQLLAEVAQKNSHVVVIMDCCHSGSGTRRVEDNPEVRVRRAPTDTRLRPPESFVHYQQIQQQTATRGTREDTSGWTIAETGRAASMNGQIVLAACRSDEEAKEYPISGQRRGVFSFFIEETLKTSGGGLTYRDLYKRANVLVRNSVYDQSPQIESAHPSDVDRPFLGGAVSTQKANYTVQHAKRDGWIIDGGAVHGVLAPVGDETTVLALYPMDASPEVMRNLEASVGTARVTEVLANRSKIAIELKDGSAPPENTTYRAVIVDLPVTKLPVLFEGDAEGLALARQGLATANGGQPSLYVREMQPQEAMAVQLRLIARDGQYVILRPGDTVPLIRPISNYTTASANLAVARLEHIARWIDTARLENPATRLGPDAVQVDVFSGYEGEELQLCPPGEDIRAEFRYDPDTGQWKQPVLRFQLTNKSNQCLYCALLELGSSYYISSALIPGGGEWLDPDQSLRARVDGSEILHPFIEDDLWKQGATEIRDTYKVIASTDEFDATLLHQDMLDSPFTRSATRSLNEMNSTLDRLLYRTQHRGLVGPGANKPRADWTTNTLPERSKTDSCPKQSPGARLEQCHCATSTP